MKKFKALVSIVLAIALTAVLGLSANAWELPDLEKTGSVTVHMRMGDTAIVGGSLTLYRVGDIYEKDGAFLFKTSGSFENSGVSLDEVLSPEPAIALSGYAAKNSTPEVETLQIGSNGSVTFSDLEAALYLVVQKDAAKGYSAITPFLISMPFCDGDKYIYDVDASPKVQIIPDLDDDKPNLPQTGQIKWPIPILAVTGCFLFAVGLYVSFGGKKKNEE